MIFITLKLVNWCIAYTMAIFHNLLMITLSPLLQFTLESCVGRVNPRGLRVPAFARRVREPALLCMRVRVEIFFVRVTEHWVKARELNQLKNRKTRGCTVRELFASIALTTVSLQQLLHYDVTIHCCATLAQTRVPTFGEFVPGLGISATFGEKFGDLRYLGIF